MHSIRKHELNGVDGFLLLSVRETVNFPIQWNPADTCVLNSLWGPRSANIFPWSEPNLSLINPEPWNEFWTFKQTSELLSSCSTHVLTSKVREITPVLAKLAVHMHKLLTCSHSTPSCCPGLYHALKSTLEPGRETATLCKQACYCGPAAIHSRQTANTHTHSSLDSLIKAERNLVSQTLTHL